jgi:hypothetical protein
MKLAVPFLVLAVLAAAGCGGTQGTGTGASDIVPVSAAAFIQVDTDPGSAHWKAVNELAGRFPDKQKAVDSLKKEMRSSGLDWEKDVKPALGKELDLVWLDFARGGKDFVALLKPKDEHKFAEFVGKGNKGESTKVVYEKFQGWEVASDNQAAIARFEQASKTASASLSTNVYFQRATHELGDALVRAYVNGSAVMSKFHTAVGANNQDVVNEFGNLDWAAANLAASSSGVGLNVLLHGTPGKLFKGIHLTTYQSHLASAVPQNAILYWTFHGSGGLFGGLNGSSPVLGSPQFRPFRDVLNQIGKLMAGEDALYVRPAVDPKQKIPEIALVTEPAHGTNGAATLDRLLRRYRKQLGTTPAHAPNGDRVLNFGGFNIWYANAHKNLVVTNYPDAILNLQRQLSGNLSQNADYQDALRSAGVPSKTQGYLYVNIHSTVPLVEHLAQMHLPAEVRRNLAPLRSALEYEVARSHEIEVSFFLRIK